MQNRRALLLLHALLLCLPVAVHAETKPTHVERRISSQPPLQVDLLAPLDIGKLAVGSAIASKARVDWNSPSCHIAHGSVVVGHVIEIEHHSKQNKGSSVSILFDQADCNGHLSPATFTLFAIVTTPPPDEGIAMVDQGGIFRNAGPSVHMTMGGGGGPPPPPPIDLKNEESVQNRLAGADSPSVILPGQVIGAKNITLSVGTGPQGSSVLSTSKGNIHFQGETQLVLVFHPAPPAPSTEEAKSAPPANDPPPAPAPQPIAEAKPAPPPPPDETSICTDPCSDVSLPADTNDSHADKVLSTARLGFTPHDRHEFSHLDFESTVTYLDASNLLYTFDPHKMRKHVPEGYGTESLRTIRAVLLDPKTLHVKRMEDWQIRGDGQYLWPAGPGRVLVHRGQRLILLGPKLDVLHEYPAPARVIFVSADPSGNHFAIGTLHERYTRQMHDILAISLDAEPEEDVDITLLDEDLQPLLTARQDSTQPPPVLSNNGEIRLHYVSSNRWSLSEIRWDRSTHNIATFNSDCHPSLSTPLPDSIFVVGCAKSPLHNWYRMLRLDGHVLLKGTGSSEEIAQSSTSDSADVFAIRVIHTRISKSFTDSFFKDDLREQQIGVYNRSNGKRLMLITDHDVSLVEQSFALSPSGHQIAILSSADLSLYRVAPGTK